MNGARIIERRPSTIFIRMPREQWRSAGRCDCPVCQGGEGFWDTLAVATENRPNDYAWTVHMPDKA